ncbi:MAG: MdtA/MuxA family multidrug efflux RND transporter periplasmic adaptor subunit [Acidobacteriia bacterium]|nr:MdtA/MuxA family multidrug efflux RND transporter periplasmic adaptor subunit [Terriglobia bacterium]
MMSAYSPLEGSNTRIPPSVKEEEMKVRAHKRYWLWLLILILLAGVAWGAYKLRARSQEASAGKPGPGAGRAVPVAVAPVESRDVPVYLEGLGSVTAFNTVTVKSRVDGQLVEVVFREGQFVRAGDFLAQIDPRPYQVALDQMQGQLAKDQAQLDGARIDYARYQKLSQEGVTPRQQFDTQSALVNQLEGSVRADQAQINNQKLNLTYCRITAPIGGRIGLRLVDQGNIIHANDPNGLVVITQLQPIAVIFTLPQDQLPLVYKKLRDGVKFPADAYDRDNTTKLASGTLLTIDNQIDPNTGTYKLKAVFGNEDNVLFPNQFVNVHLLVDTRRGLTVVPAAAIQRGPQGAYVYVVTGGDSAKIRPVTIALTSGSYVGINEGLRPGESVVVDGQDKLQDGSKIDARTPTGGTAGAGGPGGGQRGGQGGRGGARGAGGRSQ